VIRLTFLVGACVVSGLLTAGVAIAVWQYRPRSGATWLAVTLGGVTMWSLGQAVSLAAESVPLARGAHTVSLLGMGVTALAWLLFGFRYTGRDSRWWPWTRTLVWVPLAVVLALAVAVPDAVYVDHAVDATGAFTFGWGTSALAFFGYGYLANLTGNGMLAIKLRHSRNVYRRRTAFFLFGGVLVIVGHILSVAGVSPLPQHTLVPVLFLGIGLGSLVILVDDRVLRVVSLQRLLSVASNRFEALTPLARDAVIEEMGSSIIVLDGDNRIVDLNPTARQLLDAEGERVVGTDIEAVLDIDQFGADELPFLDPSVTDGTFSEIWLTFEDGTRRCYDIVLTGLEAGGETVGRVAIVHDVTDLQRQKRELERQNERLEEFASLVSHDLRNPLNVATGHVALTKETGDLSHLEDVQTAHDRMLHLIDDMLSLARQGRTLDETGPVALEQSARDAWDTVETEQATLDVVDSGTLIADSGRLQRLFENLYRNSVEHAGADVAVTVGTREGGFFVDDDGPGIPESERETVFEAGHTNVENGTGFGLAIVKQIADAHGWTVDVRESESGGARFDFGDVESATT
jgi:PAS domain S-box-containing protein